MAHADSLFRCQPFLVISVYVDIITMPVSLLRRCVNASRNFRPFELAQQVHDLTALVSPMLRGKFERVTQPPHGSHFPDLTAVTKPALPARSWHFYFVSTVPVKESNARDRTRTRTLARRVVPKTMLGQ